MPDPMTVRKAIQQKIVTKGVATIISVETQTEAEACLQNQIFPTYQLLLTDTNSSYGFQSSSPNCCDTFKYLFCICIQFLFLDTFQNQIPAKSVLSWESVLSIEVQAKERFESLSLKYCRRISNSPKFPQKTLFKYFDSAFFNLNVRVNKKH